MTYQRLREPGCRFHGKQGIPGAPSWEGRQGRNMQGADKPRDGSALYPERNGVPLKGFKQWADRPDLCFEKEPLYLTDWVRGGEVNTR